jgi:hypothetical protein
LLDRLEGLDTFLTAQHGDLHKRIQETVPLLAGKSAIVRQPKELFDFL